MLASLGRSAANQLYLEYNHKKVKLFLDYNHKKVTNNNHANMTRAGGSIQAYLASMIFRQLFMVQGQCVSC